MLHRRTCRLEDFAEEQPLNGLEEPVLGKLSNSLLSDPAAAFTADGGHGSRQTHLGQRQLWTN